MRQGLRDAKYAGVMTPTPSQLDRARFVRTILARHDHNQADLAKLLGITQPAAGRKLRGLRRFEVDELALIARSYGVDIEHLVEPPEAELSTLLGCVRKTAADLLTCTKYQALLLISKVAARYGYAAKTALIQLKARA